MRSRLRREAGITPGTGHNWDQRTAVGYHDYSSWTDVQAVILNSELGTEVSVPQAP
jgi:hypothetical protein